MQISRGFRSSLGQQKQGKKMVARETMSTRRSRRGGLAAHWKWTNQRKWNWVAFIISPSSSSSSTPARALMNHSCTRLHTQRPPSLTSGPLLISLHPPGKWIGNKRLTFGMDLYGFTAVHRQPGVCYRLSRYLPTAMNVQTL